MRLFVAVAMITMGLGIAGIWTFDLLRGEKVDLSRGVFQARNPDDGSLFWLHWLAEYGTAILLVAGGIGLLAESDWSRTVAAASLGALLYTSVNSMGWAVARQERRAYVAPMAFGIVVAAIGLIWLLV